MAAKMAAFFDQTRMDVPRQDSIHQGALISAIV